MAAPSRELDPAQNAEYQIPVENPLPQSFHFNPIIGLTALPDLADFKSSQTAMPPLVTAVAAGRVAFPEGMNTHLSRRDLFKRAAGIGAAAAGAALLRPGEARAEGEEELPGLVEQFPPIDPTPQAESLMDQDFEVAAKNTLNNIDRFRKWIEEVDEETGESGAEEFHKTFAELRSEIQQAQAFNLTPPELVTDPMDAVTNAGPFGYPADFSEGEPKAARFFGKVAFGHVPDGQKVDENLLIGGEADVVLFGVTFHDFTSQATDAEGKPIKGKVVLIHFGGVNENKAWNASGFYNVIWPNGEYYSSLSQFRVETNASNTQRQWPYDIDVEIPAPQAGQAGINQMVECVGKGMASISVGSTINYDYMIQWAEDFKKQYKIDPFAGLAPDFKEKEFLFRTNAVGQKLLQRLQLHAVNAMIEEPEISGRELGIVQYGTDGSRLEHIGSDAIKSLFPKAADSDKWPKVKETSYFLDRPTLTMEDIYELPNIVGAKRFANPAEFPQAAGVMNPAY